MVSDHEFASLYAIPSSVTYFSTVKRRKQDEVRIRQGVSSAV